MIKLKPCPFCGGKADLVPFLNYGGTWKVVCHKCEIGTFVFFSPESAAKRWNRRVKKNG